MDRSRTFSVRSPRARTRWTETPTSPSRSQPRRKTPSSEGLLPPTRFGASPSRRQKSGSSARATRPSSRSRCRGSESDAPGRSDERRRPREELDQPDRRDAAAQDSLPPSHSFASSRHGSHHDVVRPNGRRPFVSAPGNGHPADAPDAGHRRLVSLSYRFHHGSRRPPDAGQ